jgi:hypothetical protein
VDLAQCRLTLPGRVVKGNRALGIPLNESAMQVLAARTDAHGDYVFTYRGQPLKGVVNTAWRAALAKAGISDLRFHDLRHTWASLMIQNGVPKPMIKELGGWRSERMVDRYAHLEPAHLAPHAQVIDRVLGGVLSRSNSSPVKRAEPRPARSSALRLACTAALAGALQACGGGAEPEPANSPPERWARLVSYGVNPTTLRAPATTSEVQHLNVAYDVDFRSNTDLPTYRLTTHVLPLDEPLVSADQSRGRLHTQFCGQGGNACGNPHEKVCDVQAGWLDPADRHVRCDAYNPALELPPGSYRFVGNVCEIRTSAVTNCTSQSVTVTFE